MIIVILFHIAGNLSLVIDKMIKELKPGDYSSDEDSLEYLKPEYRPHVSLVHSFRDYMGFRVVNEDNIAIIAFPEDVGLIDLKNCQAKWTGDPDYHLAPFGRSNIQAGDVIRAEFDEKKGGTVTISEHSHKIISGKRLKNRGVEENGITIRRNSDKLRTDEGRHKEIEEEIREELRYMSDRRNRYVDQQACLDHLAKHPPVVWDWDIQGKRKGYFVSKEEPQVVVYDNHCYFFVSKFLRANIYRVHLP